jgi:hypothetical protein
VASTTAYVNAENRLPEQVVSYNHAKQAKMAKNVTGVVRATRKLVCAHANKVLPVKLVNYNATKNVTTMVVVSQRRQHGHCVTVNLVSEALAAKFKLAALEIKVQKVHVLVTVIV